MNSRINQFLLPIRSKREVKVWRKREAASPSCSDKPQKKKKLLWALNTSGRDKHGCCYSGTFTWNSNKKGTKGFSLWKTFFHFTPDLLWQEFSQTLQRIVAHHGTHLAPTGSLKLIKLAVTNLIDPLECSSIVRPINFQVLPTLIQMLSVPDWFTRLMHVIEPKALGNIPCGAPGLSRLWQK